MTIFLIGMYIFVLIVRPMDWWQPIYQWQLISVGSMVLGLVAVPTLTNRFKMSWQQVPQLKIAVWFWIGLMLSHATKFYFTGVVLVFQDFGKVIFFFVLLLVLVEKTQQVHTLIWALELGILFLAVHAILQYHTGVGFGGKLPLPRRDPATQTINYQARAFGTFDDPNDLCLILVVGIPLFYVLFKTGTNPIRQLITLMGAVLCAYGAWCTNSRGGVVGALGMLGAFVVVRMKGIKRYLIAGIGFGLVTVLAPSRFAGGAGIGKDRSALWGDGLNMFKSNPLFGVGYLQFINHTDRFQVAHNSYVHTLAEGGLAAYLPFFLLLYLTMVHLRRLTSHEQILSRNDHQILSGVFAALAGDFTAMYFISRQYQHILYVLLAIGIVLTHVTSRKYNLHSEVFGPVKKDIRLGLLWGVASIVVLWISIRVVNTMS